MSSLTMLLDSYLSSLSPFLVYLIYILFLSILGFVSYYKHLLTLPATLFSVLFGFIVLYSGGISSFCIFLFFFISCSVLTKVCNKKSEKRNIYQVIANGGMAVIGMMLYKKSGNPIFLVAYSTSLSEATADTFESSIGSLSKKEPFSIVTLKRVPKGLSGGVSLTGLIGGMIGSLLIGLLHILTFGWNIKYFLIITFCGFFCTIIDSFLGGFLQVLYKNKNGELTEKEKDEDGTKNEIVRGVKWINNDMVNIISTLTALLLGLLLSL